MCMWRYIKLNFMAGWVLSERGKLNVCSLWKTVTTAMVQITTQSVCVCVCVCKSMIIALMTPTYTVLVISHKMCRKWWLLNLTIILGWNEINSDGILTDTVSLCPVNLWMWPLVSGSHTCMVPPFPPLTFRYNTYIIVITGVSIYRITKNFHEMLCEISQKFLVIRYIDMLALLSRYSRKKG